MTRKLGRLLVVALVVAAVVAPMSVASADVGFHPQCAGIDYDAANPYHILYPTAIDFRIVGLVDQWDLWDFRHYGVALPVGAPLIAYINFNMTDVSNVLGAPPAGENYVFFWNDVLFGTPPLFAPVRIVGTPYDDIICGGPGHDVIKGQAGNDFIVGGRTDAVMPATANDDDIITGGPGNDIIIGGWGHDAVEGRSGNDTIYGYFPPDDAGVPGGPYPFAGPLDDTNDLWGGSGDDAIYTGDIFPDTAWGGPGSDLLVGGDAANMLTGQGGNDTIFGGLGADRLYGDKGDDVISGEAGVDWISGGFGNDTLYADENPALYTALNVELAEGGVMFGAVGNDTIIGDAGADKIRGGPGDDMIDARGGADTDVQGGAGNDTMYGGFGADVLSGGLGNDTLYGGPMANPTNLADGDDTLYGDMGSDILYGGNGNDGLWGDGAGFGAVSNYSGALFGLEGNDTLYGGEGSDQLFGGKGVDTLYGEAGDDWLYGNRPGIGFGSWGMGDSSVDTMYGGAGNDIYFGSSAATAPPDTTTVNACTDLDAARELLASDGAADIADRIPDVSILVFFETVITCGA